MFNIWQVLEYQYLCYLDVDAYHKHLLPDLSHQIPYNDDPLAKSLKLDPKMSN